MGAFKSNVPKSRLANLPQEVLGDFNPFKIQRRGPLSGQNKILQYLERCRVGKIEGYIE